MRRTGGSWRAYLGIVPIESRMHAHTLVICCRSRTQLRATSSPGARRVGSTSLLVLAAKMVRMTAPIVLCKYGVAMSFMYRSVAFVASELPRKSVAVLSSSRKHWQKHNRLLGPRDLY